MNQDPWTPIRSIPDPSNLPGTSQIQPQASTIFDDGETDPLGESTLYDYWLVIFKFRILIIASTVGITLLATVYAFLVTPLYTATSKIRIGTYEPVLASTSVEGIYQEQSKEANYLGTQIQQISSFSVGDRVLRDQQIRQALDTPKSKSFWSILFGESDVPAAPKARSDQSLVYENDVNLIKGYLGMISVSPVRRTSLVQISATSNSPSLSSRIANVHAREYREWLRESHVQQRSDTLQFLREQASELRQKVAGLARELADYAELHSIVAVNKDENITAQRMSQLSNLLTQVTADRIQAENVFKKSQDLNRENSAAYDDSTTLQMRTTLGTVKAEYSRLLEKFTPEYPRVKQLNAQIKELEAGIVEQREQIISGLRSKAIALELEEKRLKEELEQQKSKTFELAKKQVEYNVLSRELESSRELLQNVLRQSKESALAIEGNPSNVSLVDHAITPSSPSYPRKGLLIMAGMGFGVGIGMALAFLLSHLDNTIRSPELLTKVTSLPNLGMVPSFESERLMLAEDAEGGTVNREDGASNLASKVEKHQDTNLPRPSDLSPMQTPEAQAITFLKDPRSLASEAYRTIRTGILLSQAGEPPRSILVTSSHSSEGKTTSAINLAASLSSSGGTVVIIDCDLRRPSLMRYFQLEGSPSGVVEVITGSEDLESVKINNLLRRITIIPSGRIPPNPAELIGSLEMKRILDLLREQYDFVILDSPPVLPVTDSVVLSRYVDGAILVVKGGATPKRLVTDAVGRLRSVGTRIIGTILNDVDFQGADYHYYNRYYSAYYQRDPHTRSGEEGSDRKASGAA